MGRAQPSRGIQPAALRKDIRAKKAKATVNKDIPALLQAYPRARNGVLASELIGNPSNKADEETTSDGNDSTAGVEGGNRVRVQVADTLQSASLLHDDHKSTKYKFRIGILNMASPLRPGGGFLTGATSQEESLCMRTTIYPALREEFYRLPEIGGIYTPDVLVFRSGDDEGTNLDKDKRFFVDVISSGMLRFPDIEEAESEGTPPKYASAKDRRVVEDKMRAVLSICRLKNISKIVLGAWGCGAYGNPVEEIAEAWKKVLDEKAQGLEAVFAVKNKIMAERFGKILDVEVEYLNEDEQAIQAKEQDGRDSIELKEKVHELRMQVSQARNPELRQRLQTVVADLEAQLPDS